MYFTSGKYWPYTVPSAWTWANTTTAATQTVQKAKHATIRTRNGVLADADSFRRFQLDVPAVLEETDNTLPVYAPESVACTASTLPVVKLDVTDIPTEILVVPVTVKPPATTVAPPDIDTLPLGTVVSPSEATCDENNTQTQLSGSPHLQLCKTQGAAANIEQEVAALIQRQEIARGS